MTDQAGEPRWYFGESTRAALENYLEHADDGTFTVFKPRDETGKLVLALKAYDEVNFKDILYKDRLYGFAEPLQFTTVEDALDTFNNNVHSRFYQMLKEPLDMSPPPRKLSVLRCTATDPLSLLKHLRSTAKLRTEKDEEICALQDELKQLNEELQRLCKASEALGSVMRMIERQIEKHKSLQAGVVDSRTPSTDIQELSDNYQKLTARMAEERQKKERTDIEKQRVERRTNDKLQLKNKCRAEVEDLQMELEHTRSNIHQLYPQLTMFADRLLADDSCSSYPVVTPVAMSKSQAAKHLKHGQEGSFIIWTTNRRDVPYCISIAFDDAVIVFQILRHDGYLGFDETTCIFEDLQDLVINYSRIPFGCHEDQYGDLTLRHQWTPAS